MTLDLFDGQSNTMTDEETINRALRPECFNDYVGQEDLKKKLKISIEAARQRGDALDSVLLTGPAGTGKTTMAVLIAKEYGSECKTVMSTAIKSVADIIEVAKKAKAGDVIFIDEIHALEKKVEETLYSILEDNFINIKLGNKEIIKVNVEPFCLVGATTMPGKMSPPLRDRFGISHSMSLYSDEELGIIIEANSKKLGIDFDGIESILNLSRRARGIPRIANRLLRRVRDYAQVKKSKTITSEIVNDSMELEGIDELGLSKTDMKYINTLYYVYGCGPAGVAVLAASCNEDRYTIEDVVEPNLVRLGFIARTQKGRILTQKGMEHLKESEIKNQNGV